MAKEPGVTITERGSGRAARDVHALGKRANDIRPATSAIRSEYRRAELEQFATEGHGKWPKLAEATRRIRHERGQSTAGTLRASGALYRSLTAARGAGQIDVREPHELHFGTTLPYAAFHELGKGVPQRKPIDLTEADRRRITHEIEKYVAKGQRNAGA